MDVALGQEIIHHALQTGATDAALFFRRFQRRTDCFIHYLPSSELSAFQDAELFVVVNSGCAHYRLFDKNSDVIPDRNSILSMTENCVQAARLAAVWGQSTHPLECELNRFQNDSLIAIKPDDDCPPPGKKDDFACVGHCLVPECLADLKFKPSYIIDDIVQGFQSLKAKSLLQIQMDIDAVDETLFHGSGISSQKHYETSIRQSISIHKDNHQVSLQLPEYVFSGNLFNSSDHRALLRVQEVALAFEEAVQAQTKCELPGHGYVVSGWGMAVLAHEAAHLHVNMSGAGRLVMDIAGCPDVPFACGSCRNLALNIALESSLQRDALLERVPDHAIWLDAPECWIRKNKHFIEMRFRIVAEIVGGKMNRFFQPLTVRFDLEKIWFYCKYASKPLVRIRLRCGDGMTSMQAPCGFFDLDLDPVDSLGK